MLRSDEPSDGGERWTASEPNHSHGATHMPIQSKPSKFVALGSALLAFAAQPQARDLDALIERLPPVGAERIWNPKSRQYVLDRAVIEWTAHLVTGSQLTDEQWRRALVGCDAIRVHKRWPADEFFPVFMEVPSWLGFATIRARADRADWRAASAVSPLPEECAMPMFAALEEGRFQRLGKITEGPQKLVFSVSIEHADFEPGPYDWPTRAIPAGIGWRGEIAFDVVGVKSVAEAWPPVDDERLRAAVRDAVGARMNTFGGAPCLLVHVDPDVTQFPRLVHVGLSLEVELRRDNVLRESSDLLVARLDEGASWWSLRTSRLRFFGSAAFTNALPEHFDDAGELAKWTLVVRGANRSMERLWDADSHWSGTITLPLAEALERAKTWDAQAKR